METILVVAIIAAAAAYTIWKLARIARVGKKNCSCAESCAISDACPSNDDECGKTARKEHG
jgi:hypothetical protein